ncbi:MAG: Fe-S cluster assembly protein HesB [Candidatus Chlorobium antarcticum]|nr:Fe-S cluster assembly protein HesB [Candidatus Chlorobium antarcticum]
MIAIDYPSSVSIEAFHKKIFTSWSECRRSFPWRETVDRYSVMVSECMLQQTQAERVVPKYSEWLERFPLPEALAEAPLREVLSLWSGLGYNSRAQRLQLAAQQVMKRFNGQVPSTPALLKTLPGIGEYSCRSIPAFADNLDVAAVDTNIRRILINEFSLPETLPPAMLQTVADVVLPVGRSRDWHNALMDYGSCVVTGRSSGIRPLSRQSAFKGSRRWYRARIVRELLNTSFMTVAELKDRYGECRWGLDEIILDLVAEGLVESTVSVHESIDDRILKIREG